MAIVCRASFRNRSGAFALFNFLPVLLQAQDPIATVLELPIGTSVTVTGVVLNGAELGEIRYMQDETAGIAVYPGVGSVPGFSPVMGSNITVTGVLKVIDGVLGIDPVTAFTVNSVGDTLPTPELITPTELDENHASELVRMAGCVFDDAGSAFTIGESRYTSDGQTKVIQLEDGHPLIGSEIPMGDVEITGIATQRATEQTPEGEYLVLPRTGEDLLTGTYPTHGCMIRYQYDDAGNRIQRDWYCWSPSPKSAPLDASGATTAAAQKLPEVHLSVYPNPVNDVLNVTFSQPVEMGYLEVHDAKGQRLLSQQGGGSAALINVEDLEGGTYFISFVLGEERVVSGFAITR